MPNSQFELIWYATMNITNQCIDLHRKHPIFFVIKLLPWMLCWSRYDPIESFIQILQIDIYCNSIFQRSIYLYFDKNIFLSCTLKQLLSMFTICYNFEGVKSFPKLHVSTKTYNLAHNYIDEKHTRQWNKKYNDPYSIIAFL